MNDSLNHLLKCSKTLIHLGTVTAGFPEMRYRPAVTKVCIAYDSKSLSNNFLWSLWKHMLCIITSGTLKLICVHLRND